MRIPEAEARVPAPALPRLVLVGVLVRGWVHERPDLPADEVSRDVLTRPLGASYVVPHGPVWRLLVWVLVAFSLLSWVLQHLIGR